MDYETFMNIVNEVGADKILAIHFDNSVVQHYLKGDFDVNDAINSDGNLIIRTHCKIRSQGVSGGGYDIPVTMYHSQIHSVMVLDRESDRTRVDAHGLYVN